VDFAYEVVAKSGACEGALLIVDARPGGRGADRRQCPPGDEAEPDDHPVINKIDLPHANVRKRSSNSKRSWPFRATPQSRPAPRKASASTTSSRRSWRASPRPARGQPARCRRCASTPTFDTYKGVVTHVRIFSGSLRAGLNVNSCTPARTTRSKKWGVSTRSRTSRETAGRRREPATSRPTSRVEGRQDGGYVHRCPPSGARTARGFRRSIRWCSAVSTDQHADYEHLKVNLSSCNSTTPPSFTSRRVRSPSGSGSAVASWACSTWRSSSETPPPRVRHGTSSPPTERGLPREADGGRSTEIDTPPTCPRPITSRKCGTHVRLSSSAHKRYIGDMMRPRQRETRHPRPHGDARRAACHDELPGA